MLKAHGDYILPENVPANEFLNLEDNKISTSRNWAIWLHEYLQELPNKQDVLRYVLTANAPETKDNNFTWKDFQERNNSELVADYGNFVNRALLKGVKEKVEGLLNNYKFRDAQREVMNIARIGNKYMTDCEPWKIWKTNPERVQTVLYVCLQLVANLAIAFEPFLPFSSEKLRKLIKLNEAKWEQLGNTNILTEGWELAEPELLFEKIEDEVIEAQLKKLDDIKKANEAANYKAKPIKPVVSYDDFEKLDIRVGKIITCERVKKANKLLKFTLDDGSGKERTIVSGIAKFYNPEDLVGKSVCFIANFEPRKLMGVTSEGMILSAVDFDESLSVITTSKDVKPGSQVG